MAERAVVTAADVQAEHMAAIASLTPAQAAAFERLHRARSMVHTPMVNPSVVAERLKLIFSDEAAARSAPC